MLSNSHKLSVLEKAGYGFGDAAANFVWRGALGYLAIFYTDTFGLMAAHVALLMLWVRLTDGVTDIVMGMIADRTETRFGKFRPWIMWSAPALALFMILCFTTPDLSYGGKLIWAYITYIGLTLAYTVNNVPYSALMGVMTPSVSERASLSSYRFVGAFGGGLLVMGMTPYLVDFFGKGDAIIGYQYTMYLFASLIVIFCTITYFTTQERVKPAKVDRPPFSKEVVDILYSLAVLCMPLFGAIIFLQFQNILSGIFFALTFLVTFLGGKYIISRPAETRTGTQQELVDLITNKPWLILLSVGFLFMIFNSIRYGVVAYYFTYYMGDALLTGKYFAALLIVSLLTALAVPYINKLCTKKTLFIISFVLGAAFNCAIYFLDPSQVTLIFVVGCIGEIFAAIMPVLYFGMLGDVADYSEWKTGRRATGLIYSAGSFVQKAGSGFAAAIVLLVLAKFGYDAAVESTITDSIQGMKLLMSWIPAVFGVVGLIAIIFYPLTATKMQQIEQDLQARRA
ncbi:MAG: GPH family glycoside/pentoside/hexuronide:cation symporter [Flavobacteriales bacterium]|jgi:GPH family glycoside/pentoside/hexuronide:cation symporter